MVRPAQILRTFPLFAGFTDEELELLGNQVEIAKFNRGDYLFHEGDPGDAVYLLYEGTVVADKIIDKDIGTKKDLAIIPSGTFFGEMAIIDSTPRSAGIRAEINVETLKLTRPQFERLLSDHPYIGYMLLRAFYSVVSNRLRITNEELVAIYDIGKIVASIREFTELAETVLWRLIHRLDSAFGIIATVEGRGMRVAAAVGEGAERLRGLALDTSHALIESVLNRETPLLVERFKGITEPWESESMILAPLIAKTHVSGILLLGNRDGSPPYTPSDLNLVSAVANICSPAIEVSLQMLKEGKK